MPKKEKSLLAQLIEERGTKDVAGVQELVKKGQSIFWGCAHRENHENQKIDILM